MQKEIVLGIIFIAVGLLLIFNTISSKADVQFAVGGFLGPIPFGFANNPQMLKLIIILSIVALAIYFAKI